MRLRRGWLLISCLTLLLAVVRAQAQTTEQEARKSPKPTPSAAVASGNPQARITYKGQSGNDTFLRSGSSERAKKPVPRAADIITGPGPAGGPHVKVFDGSTSLIKSPRDAATGHASGKRQTGGSSWQSDLSGRSSGTQARSRSESPDEGDPEDEPVQQLAPKSGKPKKGSNTAVPAVQKVRDSKRNVSQPSPTPAH